MPVARPDEDADQQHEADAEDDKPGLVGLEASRYGVVDDPVRVRRSGGRGVHGAPLAPSSATVPEVAGSGESEVTAPV
jgi:hypothetical protein